MGHQRAWVVLFALGLFLVVATGSVVGDTQVTAEIGAQETGGVVIDDALHGADGETEVVVSLVGSETASSPGELRAHASATQQPLVSFAASAPGVSVETQFWLTNAALVTIDTDRVGLATLADIEGVETIFRNAEFERHGPVETTVGQSVDPTASDYTYGLEQVGAPTVWNEYGTQGEGVSVAVLDTGVDADHPDLSVTKWQEFDSSGNPVDSQPNDGDGHGTHVSGTVSGAETPAGDQPSYGVAPGVDLYGVKVLADDGGGSFAQIIAGMEWAVNESADVISMSLGATGFYEQMIDPVRNAESAGTVVVTSAGNSGEGSSGSPGNVYDAISVGASNSNEDIASFSSGETVDTAADWGSSAPADWPAQYTVPSVAAPGVDTLSSVPGGGYDDTYSGTSMAAPHVSGVVALAESAVNRDLGPDAIAQALEATAFKPADAPAPPGERDTRYGSGIVDAPALIEYLQNGSDAPLLSVSASAPNTVETNETLTVNYSITNSGGVEGTESAVTLVINGTVEDSDTNVTVGSGETVSGALVFDGVDQYSDGDVINWTVELQDAGETASGSTYVGTPPEPDIVIDSIDFPAEIASDESLDVNYTLANVGGAEGTESFVDLKVNGTGTEFDDTDFDVTVPAGGTASGTLTFDNVSGHFDDGDTINFSVELFDFGDVATGSTGVNDSTGPGQPDIVIEAINYTETLPVGSPLDVEYTLKNLGSAEGTEGFVDLKVNGTGTEFDDTDTDVTVPAGGTTNGTLTFDGVDEQFEPGDNISFTVELFEFGDVAAGQTTYEVPDEPILSLAAVEAPTLIEAGEDLTVNYTIENSGGVAGTESAVELLVGGALGDTDADVTVPAQDSVTGTLTFENVNVSDALAALDGSVSTAADAGDSGVQITEAVRTASGQTEVMVDLAGSPAARTTDELQAHASDAHEPLTAFADARPGIEIEQRFWLSPMALVTVDLDRVSVADLAAVDGVEAVFENAEFERHSPVDTRVGQSVGVPGLHSQATAGNYTYGLEQINAPDVWSQYGTQGEGVSVAVLDTGVDAAHPDLNVTKWQEFDGDGNPVDSEPNDGQGHGTHVSGTVSGAETPAGDVPSYGVAPGVDLYGVKVLDDSGGGSFAQIIAGMQWATNQSTDIISMSLGATGFYEQMIDPVRNAHDAGTVVITSSGNSDAGSSGSPGNVYDSIAVGASNSNEDIASFSSGEVVDTDADWSDPPADWPDQYTVPTVAAPGVDTLSSVPGGGYDGTYSGTSMAAPHVSGAVALALSATNGTPTPAEIEQALEFTAFKPADAPAPPGERDIRYGSGIVDALALTEYLEDPPEGETIEWTVSLQDTNDTASGETFVENGSADPTAEFTVDIVSTNEPVAGETLNVTAAVENVGGAEATQSISLDVGPLGETETTVTLPAGNATETTLSLSTGADDAGTYTATVSSANDSASTNVTVVEPAELLVDNISMNEPVAGETLDMTVAVTNVGGVSASGSVNASVDGIGETGTTLTLGPGESTTETFTLDTDPGDAGEHTVTVETPHDNMTEPVEISLPELPGGEAPPEDSDDDGSYEDLNGDGASNILDVQMLFDNLDNEMVAENPWAFDFDGDGEVTIFDVQMLFEQLGN